MSERRVPAWFTKAREAAARVKSPVGLPFAAEKKQKTCTLYLYDAIGKDSWSGSGIDPMDVVKALDEAKGADELVVHVNSPGGGVFDGVTIYNTIRAFKGKKTVYVDGLAASIASVIALAGDRVITNGAATWMIHEPSWGLFSAGTADEIEEDARKLVSGLRKLRETMLDLYVSQTGQSRTDLAAWMKAETWMKASEAKAYGFTDEIAAADGCACDCAECKAGNCSDCSCGGCAACAAGESCDGGKCDQGAGAHARVQPPARAKTPAELLATARADYAHLRTQFPAASRGPKPGEPGAANATKPGDRQENQR